MLIHNTNPFGRNGTVFSNEFSNPATLYDGTSGTLDSYNGQLSMLAIELPLNVVFRIFEKKYSGFYVTAGASTMIYISQQFTADFVNEYTKQSYNTMSGEISTETKYSTVEVENDYGSFSRTDIFGLVNFSAGYSLPYSKTSTLLIEPFIQLTLNDLTSLNRSPDEPGRVRIPLLIENVYDGATLESEFNQIENQESILNRTITL